LDILCAVLAEAATRKHIVSMRKRTGKTVSEQEAAQASFEVLRQAQDKVCGVLSLRDWGILGALATGTAKLLRAVVAYFAVAFAVTAILTFLAALSGRWGLLRLCTFCR
jgi:hypothetical protein